MTNSTDLLANVAASATRRRQFLTTLATGGVGAGLAAAGVAAPSAARAATSEPFDEQFMQLALNFEYLGASLYLYALTGSGLPLSATTGIGTKGTVSAGGPVSFTSTAIHQVVEKLAIDEVAHVNVVRGALGSAKIAQPAINLSTSFDTIAHLAGFVQPGKTFNAFADEISLLIAAYYLEDLCISALAGVIGSLTSPGLVSVAAGFLGVEASQSAVIRYILASNGRGAVTDLISNLRSNLSGELDDFGTTIPGNTFNFVSSNADGMVIGRSASQVLNCAYGGGAASNFLFFPNRVNGVIKS